MKTKLILSSLFFSVSLQSYAEKNDESLLEIDLATDAKKAIVSDAGLELSDFGIAPKEKKGSFLTKIITSKEKKKAKSVTLSHSPQWLNWIPIENIGPKNLADAPVFIVKGPKDYWMFGKYGSFDQKKKRKKGNKKGAKSKAKSAAKSQFVPQEAKLKGLDIPLLTTPDPRQFDAPGAKQKSKGGYHAWQSRDMVNWVHHGCITPQYARWVTNAEFVDGKTYIYYDYPNDQDPHLFIDSDLTDGKPGEDKGMVWKDPSHGSDAGFIRSFDGKMHVIYEDWSPINARNHAWDSPLAGHAVSEDGVKPFKLLPPAVDHRTKPTGKKATFKHPHWLAHKDWDTNIAEYEIHEPEQNAYGDWAPICIGGQYYIFGDFDPKREIDANGKKKRHSMSVGWLTSSSIDKPFKWCGHVGEGHPDPDVCFAEGKFYLATQQETDFTSPGPWVEKVEVKIGIDTTGDGKIDHWGDWKEVKESYDYIKGFSKQIKKIPATINLDAYPAGFGYQFEVRMSDTTDNDSKPIINGISLQF